MIGIGSDKKILKIPLQELQKVCLLQLFNIWLDDCYIHCCFKSPDAEPSHQYCNTRFCFLFDIDEWCFSVGIFFYQKLFHRLECFSPSGRLKKSRPPPLVIENSNFFNFSDAERKVKQCSSILCAKEKEPTFKQQETPLASCFYVISSIQLVCKVFIIYNKNFWHLKHFNKITFFWIRVHISVSIFLCFWMVFGTPSGKQTDRTNKTADRS